MAFKQERFLQVLEDYDKLLQAYETYRGAIRFTLASTDSPTDKLAIIEAHTLASAPPISVAVELEKAHFRKWAKRNSREKQRAARRRGSAPQGAAVSPQQVISEAAYEAFNQQMPPAYQGPDVVPEGEDIL